MERIKKKSLTVTLSPEIIEYLEMKVKSKEFASMAHGVELCVFKYMEAEKRVRGREDFSGEPILKN